MKCSLYSDLIATKDPELAKSIKESDKDYTICQSSVLDELAQMNSSKAHTLVGRDNIQSWFESSYCKDNNNVCLLVGNLGPAWK